ncbi:hypothetical protein [Streptomyces sp. CAU 1734]|uniref:hypothetical protein n=1 Tax=Streptomyces sp. CAU 1734 TaxID=3140360 RepID=UPI003260558D
MSESADSVEYTFGFDGDETRRRLVVDLGERRPRPVDGEMDHAFTKAWWKISATRRATGAWPEAGMSAS